MVETPNAGVVNPDPAQDPNAAGQGSATPTPGAESGASGAQPDNEQKTVPITALHEEREKRQALQAQLDALKATVGTQVHYDAYGNPIPVQAAPQVSQQNDVARQLDTLWETDPRKAMQTELQLAVQWYDSVNMQLDTQENEAIKKFPDYMNYRSEVKTYLNRLPLNQRSTPRIVETAYFAVKGQYVDRIIAENQTKLLDKIKRGEQIQGLGAAGTSSVSNVPKGTQLTPEQKSVAAAMGLTEDDYIKHMKK
jgi:hypothetical protein